MSAKNRETGYDGFSAEERAAMKERVAELRVVLARIAEMTSEDREFR